VVQDTEFIKQKLVAIGKKTTEGSITGFLNGKKTQNFLAF